jgi:tungstate transport system permease protein
MLWIVLWEAKLPLLAAVMAGFGGAISEVGASMMVGGNLAGETRVLTTSVILEVSRGEFAPAIALSIILLVLIFIVNAILTTVQQQERM